MKMPTPLAAIPAAASAAALALALVSCSDDQPDEDAFLSPAARRGKQVYVNCIACHGADPTRDGPVGPAIAGASRELIAARVLRGEYPEGHRPKRNTKQMPPMPYLEPHLDDLAAYLREVEQARRKARAAKSQASKNRASKK